VSADDRWVPDVVRSTQLIDQEESPGRGPSIRERPAPLGEYAVGSWRGMIWPRQASKREPSDRAARLLIGVDFDADAICAKAKHGSENVWQQAVIAPTYRLARIGFHKRKGIEPQS